MAHYRVGPGKWLTLQLFLSGTRTYLNEPAESKKKKKIGLAALKKAFTSMWAHFAITICNNGPQRAFNTCASSIL